MLSVYRLQSFLFSNRRTCKFLYFRQYKESKINTLMSEAQSTDTQNSASVVSPTTTNPRLCEYFAVLGLEQTDLSLSFKAQVSIDSKDVGFRPIVKYVYNGKRIGTTTTTTTQSTLPPLAQRTSSIKKSNNSLNVVELTPEQIQEECEILMQIRKYCFPDLTDIINKSLAVMDKFRTGSKCYQALFEHSLQSEKFDFVLARPGSQRLYGHCRRIYNISACFDIFFLMLKKKKKKKKKNESSLQMPICLCLISKYQFLLLFDQIMDHVLARWLCSPEAIFPFLDSLLMHPTPSLGDILHVEIKSQFPNVPNDVTMLWLHDTHNISLRPLFMCLSIDIIILLLSCILTEKNVCEPIFGEIEWLYLWDCGHTLSISLASFTCSDIARITTKLPKCSTPFHRWVEGVLGALFGPLFHEEMLMVDLDNNSMKSSYKAPLLKLPYEPTWKLKRELIRLVKKSKELLAAKDSSTAANQSQSASSLKTKTLKIFENVHGERSFFFFLIYYLCGPPLILIITV
ncbi:hypothetical protein RFI_15562 [Reticulomyxa filosa]|uniref:cDENN domain-containing protein n=1 Tax=Reticulomyxa filosa TaxID=46433 RepID=X6N6T2_RETFI|nr:hypothetical protein RFI_15562 [Reticulomyxa filosa]|eukprot:ETO21643.1 hypothetical protein RFI_15562 [Reticulomyxa filosa]